MPVTFTAVDWSDPDAEALRESQPTELLARYGEDSEPGRLPSASDVAIFLLARDRATGQPVGCGGLRPIGDGAAEIKRMYVVPHRRGEGLSRHLLAALEAEAEMLGWNVLRLETGIRQPEAIALYSHSGYVRVANFGPYVDSVDSICFEKRFPQQSP
jgi:GNAT superfamily N-acetyltransferase